MPLSIASVDPAPTDRERLRLQRLVARQREAIAADRVPSLAVRKERLKRLLALVRENDNAIAAAIAEDFGGRSPIETAVAETGVVIHAIGHARRRLGSWIQPRRRAADLRLGAGHAYVRPEPLGLVGIIAPWNYPFQLSVAPLVSALAAGNRAILKPSEHTPALAELLLSLFGKYFSEEEIAVITGGSEVAEALCEVPLDHLLFTGSGATARLVARAAAENLVPLTLELGGKSPVVVGQGYSLEKAAASVATGKLFNAGQTCTAPDYVLVPNGHGARFLDLVAREAEALYPDLAQEDYTAIVPKGRIRSLDALLVDAEARDTPIRHHRGAAPEGKMRPAFVLNPPPDSRIMAGEIFGPLLPILEHDGVPDAITTINAISPCPLALYMFTDDKAEQQALLNGVASGGATINDTLLHSVQEDLPFGGVGASGMGAYRGETGFWRFSHARAVYEPVGPTAFSTLRPPWGPVARQVLKLFTRY